MLRASADATTSMGMARLVTCLADECKPGGKHCPLGQQGSPGHATGWASRAVEAVSITVSGAAVPCQLALLAGVGSLRGECLEAVMADLHAREQVCKGIILEKDQTTSTVWLSEFPDWHFRHCVRQEDTQEQRYGPHNFAVLFHHYSGAWLLLHEDGSCFGTLSASHAQCAPFRLCVSDLQDGK